MSNDSETVEDTEKGSLAKVTDILATVKFIEIVPLDRASGDYHKLEFIDSVVEVKPEDLLEVKQEPADEIDNEDPNYSVKQKPVDEYECDGAWSTIQPQVSSCMEATASDIDIPVEVTGRLMQPVVVLETLNLSRELLRVKRTTWKQHVARVPRATSTVILDQGGAGTTAKTEPAATGELVTPRQHTLSTPSVGRTTRLIRYNCVNPSCRVTFTRLQNMRRHAMQFHKLDGVGKPATEAEHEAAVLAAAERSAGSRVDVNGLAGQQVKRSIKTDIDHAMRRASFQRQVGTKIERHRRFKCVDPLCRVTFTRLQNMHRHAMQFHKLNGVGEPATEAEHRAAVLAAAERSAWSRADAIGHARRRVTFQRQVKTKIKRSRRFKCVNPSCPVMFTRLMNMRRHAMQFHKLRADGEPATEAEHEAAVLAAAERTARCGVYGNGQPVRYKRSVKSEIERLANGEEPTHVDSPDLPEVQVQSVSEAAMHRSFDDQQIQAPATQRELIRERRPEDRTPTSYLHRMLQAKPTLPIRDITDKAIRRHGWTGAAAHRARLIANHLETGRQQILADIRTFIPQKLDENTALPFALRVQQYLAQFPPRPQ